MPDNNNKFTPSEGLNRDNNNQFSSTPQNIGNTALGKFSLPAQVPVIPNKPSFVLSVFGLNALRKTLLDKQEVTEDEITRRSRLNTPIYSFADIRLSTTITSNNESVFSGIRNEEGGVNGNGIESFLDTALVEISQTKNIITTTLQGRSGTIKEYISDGDYTIRIRGVLDSGSMHVYPEQQVQTLHNILKVSDAITITSAFAQLYGITDVVVTDYTFSQVPGGYNVQPYEITLLSDIPLELLPEDA